MSELTGHKGGKKNRKFGRCNRSPAGKRYIAESRWLSNRQKRVTTNAKRIMSDAARVQAMKVARGTARKLRRQYGKFAEVAES